METQQTSTLYSSWETSLRAHMGQLVNSALEDPMTCEVMLNPDGRIWQERFGEPMKCIGTMRSGDAEVAFRTLASLLGKTLSYDQPQLDGEYPGGFRFSGAVPPVVSVTGGSMGTLFDAEEDTLEISTFSTFEMEQILGMGDRWALPILLYLFRRIEKSLLGQPALLILDEAWLMLGHPIFREKIRDWFKVLRKSNCALLMATQSISDAVNSAIFDVVISETATKIFLPNPSARDIAAIYNQMGLNEHQIEILATAIPKRHYYLTSEKGCRLFNFAMGPLALALAGASDRESVQLIKKLEQQYGDEWLSVWLQSKGVSLADYMGDAA